VQGTDGNFYGTTSAGGYHSVFGEVFKITPSGTLTVLHTFVGTDGQSSMAGLVRGNDGNFYGTTQYGGVGCTGFGGCGTVFKITAGGTLTTLHSFNNTDGAYSVAPLVQGTDHNFYGATQYGGVYQQCYDNGVSVGCGTVFKMTPSGALTSLYSFCSQTGCTDGYEPYAGLIQANDGTFYGTTYLGGANNLGEIFKITSGGLLTVLHSFAGTDGSNPFAGLIQASDGNLYGVTCYGGANNDGTVFSISLSGMLTTLHSFDNTDGNCPSGGLVQSANNTFYGTTQFGGASGNGTVFKLSVSYNTLTVTTSGDGVVTSTDGFINCPGTCSHKYLDNTPVTLNATPASGWAFSGWGGACSGTGACNVTMSQDTSVSATFYQLPVTLTVSVAGDGSVTSTDGYINCPGTCTHVYQPNTQVTLNAAAASGWSFSGWTGACMGVGSCVVTMTQNLAVTAVFVEPGHGIQFTPVTPCRLVDTRQTKDPIQGGTSQSYTLPQLGGCNIPSSAAAYSLNVTVVPITTLGYLTIWPTGEAQPVVSTMNSPDGRVKANAAIVPAGTNGAVSVYVTDTTNVILDIDGYFEPAGSGTYQFYPLTPCRLVDTRGTDGDLGGPRLAAQAQRSFPLLESSCIPAGLNPLAYSLNFTVVPNPSGQQLGYLSVWPTGETQPVVSTLNNPTATVVANGAIVPAGTGGAVDVYAYNTTDLLIDINGYFAAPGTGGFSMYPVAPCRVLDTRHSGGSFQGEKTVNVEGSACAPPANAAAYIFNATVVPPAPMLYLTLWPDGEKQPTVSTLNAADGFITSNMAIVPTTNGSIDAYAYALTQLILDISGYFAP